MAAIKPFRAIRPNPVFADQLVLTKPQTASVAGEVLPPLKTLLETGARLRPETQAGQAEAFAAINGTLRHLLENGTLLQDEQPGIYVYEVESPACKQTGIWAVTDRSNYTNGTIRTHELTFGDSVRRLTNYRLATGLEGSPVLLAYAPDPTINRLIAQAKSGPHSTLGNHLGLHRLWKIEAPDLVRQLVKAFEKVGPVYLADGHHRFESAAQTPFPDISSLYLSTDELRIREYDRVVLPEVPAAPGALLQQLMRHFDLLGEGSDRSIQPREPHRFGLFLGGTWYHLLARPHTYQDQSPGRATDAAILQQYVLAPVFGIKDPKTDPRLKCLGGEQALPEINALLDAHPGAIAFTLCPLAVSELTAVADAGEVLPPKSSWIDPKIPYGLLMNHHKPTI
ncbi:DUF1015 family protein [Mucilaginibacter paludis]|uniref:Uncharacterized conserved protein UCP033563 n=1 Tax=Mucilaginibacter paludis DSM 18603 TaxID=714943 RepID=H1Y3F4_9SPHI|nr:DUF1015 domain-containing protein [Mucilaginibacter paludis]EHQ29722.1 Uncharacterized conserved protein UCP033563 [Mucilaginibacter paludis DSM 18603]